jgi:phage gp46-like protein
MAEARRVDVKLVFDSDTLEADVEIEAGDLRADNGLETAIILSLFCDARATDEELERLGADDPRGWWGDALSELGDEYGSRLWLLAREKETPETARRAKEYAERALAWFKEDGVAESVTVRSYWKERGVLALEIDMQRPNKLLERFAFAWEV